MLVFALFDIKTYTATLVIWIVQSFLYLKYLINEILCRKISKEKGEAKDAEVYIIFIICLFILM